LSASLSRCRCARTCRNTGCNIARVPRRRHRSAQLRSGARYPGFPIPSVSPLPGALPLALPRSFHPPAEPRFHCLRLEAGRRIDDHPIEKRGEIREYLRKPGDCIMSVGRSVTPPAAAKDASLRDGTRVGSLRVIHSPTTRRSLESDSCQKPAPNWVCASPLRAAEPSDRPAAGKCHRQIGGNQ